MDLRIVVDLALLVLELYVQGKVSDYIPAENNA